MLNKIKILWARIKGAYAAADCFKMSTVELCIFAVLCAVCGFCNVNAVSFFDKVLIAVRLFVQINVLFAVLALLQGLLIIRLKSAYPPVSDYTNVDGDTPISILVSRVYEQMYMATGAFVVSLVYGIGILIVAILFLTGIGSVSQSDVLLSAIFGAIITLTLGLGCMAVYRKTVQAVTDFTGDITQIERIVVPGEEDPVFEISGVSELPDPVKASNDDYEAKIPRTEDDSADNEDSADNAPLKPKVNTEGKADATEDGNTEQSKEDTGTGKGSTPPGNDAPAV